MYVEHIALLRDELYPSGVEADKAPTDCLAPLLPAEHPLEALGGEERQNTPLLSLLSHESHSEVTGPTANGAPLGPV